MAFNLKAAETASAICQAIEALAARNEIDATARFAEIADYAEALGNYVTGTEEYIDTVWLPRWEGINLVS